MGHIVSTKKRDGDFHLEIEKYPDQCPICHYAIEPKLTGLHWFKHEGPMGGGRFEMVFKCSRHDCEHLFIGKYFKSHQFSDIYYMSEATPFELREIDVPAEVEKISETFAKTYREASKAERLQLKLICGPGYRKALEFLIKDYLTSLFPADAEKIASLKLGDAISNYVKNENVVSTAKRAAWLGNDETHFVKKWEDKDLSDLKGLISLTAHWIQMELLTKKMEKDMPQGKK